MTTRLTTGTWPRGLRSLRCQTEQGGVGAGGAEQRAEQGQRAGGGARDGAAGACCWHRWRPGSAGRWRSRCGSGRRSCRARRGPGGSRPRSTSSAGGPGMPAWSWSRRTGRLWPPLSGPWRSARAVRGWGVWMSQAAGRGLQAEGLHRVGGDERAGRCRREARKVWSCRKCLPGSGLRRLVELAGLGSKTWRPPRSGREEMMPLPGLIWPAVMP